jgi:serine/threonine protein kinase
VQFWEVAPGIEVRLRALAASNAVAAVFLEYVPFTLRGWLDYQLTATGQDVALVVAMVERELLGADEHMRAAGVVHFDAHLDNVLTSGEHLVLSDFGVATGHGFQLDDAERQFLEHHADHDIAYCAAELTNTILRGVMTFPSAEVRSAWIRQCARLALSTELWTRSLRQSGVTRPPRPLSMTSISSCTTATFRPSSPRRSLPLFSRRAAAKCCQPP